MPEPDFLNSSLVALESAARTATPSVATYRNPGFKGVHVIVDVTALSATPSVVVKVEGQDPATEEFYEILSGTAITDVTGTGTYVFKVYPGIEPSPGAAASDGIPKFWRVRPVHADADSITYSVGVNYLC